MAETIGNKIIKKRKDFAMEHQLTYMKPYLKIKKNIFYRNWRCIPEKTNHRLSGSLDKIRKKLVETHDGCKEIVCGWCGNLTHSYHIDEILDRPDAPLGGGSICLYCGRDVELYYQNWVYHAEFSDGCRLTQWADGVIDSGGPKHAPHLSFVPGDSTILEWGTPILDNEED